MNEDSRENDDIEPSIEVDSSDLDAACPADQLVRRETKRPVSSISGREFRRRDLINVDDLRPSLSDRIRQDHPHLPSDAQISRSELARYRMIYVEELLQQEHGEFSELDRQVAESIANQDTVAENTEEEFADQRTIGEFFSDRLADFGGSWAFLTSFAAILVILGDLQ